MALKVSALNGVKVYNCSAGKTTPQWMEDSIKKNISLRYNDEFRRRIDLIQDFQFPEASTSIQMTRNDGYIGCAGIYKPMIKVYDTENLSLKFERALDGEVVKFAFLNEGYDKMMFLRNDRTLEFHAPYGRHHTVRIPKYGRDLAYQRTSCDAFVVGSSTEAFRINLDQGRFLGPMSTNLPGINSVEINESHGLIAMFGDNGFLECWDPRDRTRVSSLDVIDSVRASNNVLANRLKSKGISLTAGKFGADGLSMAVGTSTGHIMMYDLRAKAPVLTKDHRYGLPIKDINFHQSRRIISCDSKIIKIWDQKTGTPFTSIEPPCVINDVCTVKDSGVLMLACEQPRMMVYHIPQLGPAPKWCTFLDNLTEEMEEQTGSSVYDDYKFVTREELEDWGLNHLVGSNLLRAYMHGFFMDMKLYNRVRAVADPFAYEKYVESKVKEKIDAKRETRISMKRRLPNVNKGLAEVLLKQGKLKKQVSELSAKGDTDALTETMANPLADDRFKSLFTNKDFEIDTNSNEFVRLNPHSNHKFKKVIEDSDDDEDNDEKINRDRFDLVDNEDTDGDDENDSDDDMVYSKDFKGSSLAMAKMAAPKERKPVHEEVVEEFGEEMDPARRSLYPSKRKKAAPAMYQLKQGLDLGDMGKPGKADAKKSAAKSERKKLSLEERLALQATASAKEQRIQIAPLQNGQSGFSFVPQVHLKRGRGVVDDSPRVDMGDLQRKKRKNKSKSKTKNKSKSKKGKKGKGKR